MENKESQSKNGCGEGSGIYTVFCLIIALIILFNMP
jgi:hypothetical protein